MHLADVRMSMVRLDSSPLLPTWALACRSAHERTDRFSAHGLDHVALSHQIEDDYGQVIVHAEAYGGGVHNAEPAPQHLSVIEVMEQHSSGILPRIGVIYAVD